MFSLNYCGKRAPTETDGNLTVRLVVADQSGLLPVDPVLGYAPVVAARVGLESRNYYETPSKPKTYSAVSDSNGAVEFRGLPLGEYILTVQKHVGIINPLGDVDTITVRGNKILTLQAPVVVDTIKTRLLTKSALVINEIYYAGPNNNAYYVYDQFIELYNSADTTVYLDGVILCRGRGNQNPQVDSLDYVEVLYIYQFPVVPKTGVIIRWRRTNLWLLRKMPSIIRNLLKPHWIYPVLIGSFTIPTTAKLIIRPQMWSM